MCHVGKPHRAHYLAYMEAECPTPSVTCHSMRVPSYWTRLRATPGSMFCCCRLGITVHLLQVIAPSLVVRRGEIEYVRPPCYLNRGLIPIKTRWNFPRKDGNKRITVKKTSLWQVLVCMQAHKKVYTVGDFYGPWYFYSLQNHISLQYVTSTQLTKIETNNLLSPRRIKHLQKMPYKCILSNTIAARFFIQSCKEHTPDCHMVAILKPIWQYFMKYVFN